MPQPGRPSDYTPETAAEICQRIAAGESVRHICKDDAMPADRTVWKWLTIHSEFAQQYARARVAQADVYAAEIIDIADRCRRGVITRDKDGKIETETRDMVERSRLMIDARKWAASKLAPKKYGDRVGIGLDPETAGASLEVVFTRAIDQARRAELPSGEDPGKGA